MNGSIVSGTDRIIVKLFAPSTCAILIQTPEPVESVSTVCRRADRRPVR